MIKTVLVATSKKTQEIALAFAAQYGLELSVISDSSAEEAVRSVRRMSRNNDVELVIARGAQAQSIRSQLALPVVEIRVTAQELGCVIQKARRELGFEGGTERFRVGILMFANAVCDTTSLGELLDVDIYTCNIQEKDEVHQALQQAKNAGVHLVIGGRSVCAEAEQFQIPSVHLLNGIESIQEALRFAGTVAEAMEKEKRHNNETNVLLNYSFSGILKINIFGEVERANHLMETLLRASEQELIRKNILQLIPRLDESLITGALVEGRETYSELVEIRDSQLVMNIIPLNNNRKIEGAILTFNEGRRIRQMEAEIRRQMLKGGYLAQATFDKVVAESAAMKALIKKAKTCARHDAPLIIYGEDGVGKQFLAECIHNENSARKNAFVAFDCSALSERRMDELLFGRFDAPGGKEETLCMAELAQNGTLFLENIHMLSRECQFKLCQLLSNRLMKNSDIRPIQAKVRVIASSPCDLLPLVKAGEFRKDLYYALNVMQLSIPSLKGRNEDLVEYIELFIQTCAKANDRFIKLTRGAADYLKTYPWTGNLNELKSVCESVVLFSPKRVVDEVFLQELFPIPDDTGADRTLSELDQKSTMLISLMKKYNGDREKVAQELGISRSTLWRHLKKYGISPDFTRN